MKTTKTILLKKLHGAGRNWCSEIPGIQLAINGKISSLTGSTAFSLMFAREMINYKNDEVYNDNNSDQVSLDVSDIKVRHKKLYDIIFPALEDRVSKIKNKQADSFNKRHKIIGIDIPVGAFCMKKNINPKNKFEPKYEGPFKVVGRTRNNTYILQDTDGVILKTNSVIQDLKMIADKPESKSAAVERIINHRGNSPNFEYLVEWKDNKQQEYVPAANFNDIAIIQNYWKQKQKQGHKTRKRRKKPLKII